MVNENKTTGMDNSPLKYREEFETVYGIIATHRKRVVRAVNNESMSMVVLRSIQTERFSCVIGPCLVCGQLLRSSLKKVFGLVLLRG